MPDHRFRQFSALEATLCDAGVAPRHIRRIVRELDDHVEDLVRESIDAGMTAEQARDAALGRIGDPADIAGRILQFRELRSWIYRYPRVARLYLPVAYALLLPAAPVFAGIANPAVVMRWGVALMLGAGVTAAMFLSMQLAIILT